MAVDKKPLIGCLVVLSLCMLACGGCFGFLIHWAENQPEYAIQTSETFKVDGVIAHVGKRSVGNRSQITAATTMKEPEQLRVAALKLAEHYWYEHAMVNFYGDRGVVDDLPNRGRMLEEESWIGYVSVDLNTNETKIRLSPLLTTDSQKPVAAAK